MTQWRQQKIPLIELYGMWTWLPSTSAVKTRLAGVVDDRRWGEMEMLLAAQTTYLQALLKIVWVGFRLPDLPTLAPVATPRTRADVAAERLKAQADAENDKVHTARLDHLRQLRPPPVAHNLQFKH
ncbi:hypothetical protein [Actinomadura litoris]|uniref:hypothetical protein n=1 Tax=Actinomadura litoris TaxID=2678616 RepID=UPI001FA79133|nr:hypothetical protein [Actinomadura litoris]